MLRTCKESVIALVIASFFSFVGATKKTLFQPELTVPVAKVPVAESISLLNGACPVRPKGGCETNDVVY